jgi:hypothetical protein
MTEISLALSEEFAFSQRNAIFCALPEEWMW